MHELENSKLALLKLPYTGNSDTLQVTCYVDFVALPPRGALF